MRGRRRGGEESRPTTNVRMGERRRNGTASADPLLSPSLNTSAVLIPEVAGIKREDFVQDIVHLVTYKVEVQNAFVNGDMTMFDCVLIN